MAKFVLEKSRAKQEIILDTSKIILTAKRGNTWAVCMDKLLRDSFFHELLDLDTERQMTSIKKALHSARWNSNYDRLGNKTALLFEQLCEQTEITD